MIKKLIIVLIVLLCLPVLALAANDVTFPETAYFELTDDGLTFGIDTSSTFDSFTVNSGNIEFTVSASSVISIFSTDKKAYTVTGVNTTYMTVSSTCTNAQSNYLLIVSTSATDTYTITIDPSGSCSGGGGTNSGDSPGAPGGGGGGGAVPSSDTQTAITTTSVDNQSSGGGSVTLQPEVTQIVSADSGGQASLSDNSIAIALPANAISESGSITVTPQSNYSQPTKGYSAIGLQAYNITAKSTAGASISQFSNSATLTFNYTNDQITNLDENTMVVSYWAEDTGEWVDLPTTIDPANNTVTATVDHLTRFILQAKSTSIPTGSLIKTANNSAVYYLGHDNKRYTFADDKTYYSWYADFDDVITVNTETMVGFEVNGNITVRPGTKLVQFVSYDYEGKMLIEDPNVSAMEPGGLLRWVETAEIASSLYGTSWEQKIIPIQNVLFGYYTIGSSLTDPTYSTGSLVKETSSDTLYYIDGVNKRQITTNGKSTNNFQDMYILTASSLSAYPVTASLNDYQNSISWTGGK